MTLKIVTRNELAYFGNNVQIKVFEIYILKMLQIGCLLICLSFYSYRPIFFLNVKGEGAL